MDKQSVTVDELRIIQDDLSERSRAGYMTAVQNAYMYAANVIGSILPPKRRPTLAEMTPEERAECEFMQCDAPGLKENGLTGVITQIWGNGASVMSSNGVHEEEDLSMVTPRPDLPKLEWPGDGVVDANIVEDDEPDSIENEQITAWIAVANHPIFNECFSAESGSLLDAMIRKLDRMAEIEELANRK